MNWKHLTSVMVNFVVQPLRQTLNYDIWKQSFYKLRPSFAASRCFTHLIAGLERREFLHVCLCRGYPDCYLKINTKKTRYSILLSLFMLTNIATLTWHIIPSAWVASRYDTTNPSRCPVEHLLAQCLWGVSLPPALKMMSQFAWIFGSLDLYDFVMYGEASCSHVWSCGAELRRAA